MPSTTSAAMRKPICTFGVASLGRPLFSVWNWAGNTSLNGRALAKSASVHSGLSSRLVIAGPFAGVRLPQGDRAQRVASHGEGQDVQALSDQSCGPPSGFTVIAAVIFPHDRRLEVEIHHRGERDAMLLLVDQVLCVIELDLHFE